MAGTDYHTLLIWRKSLLDAMGGLPQPVVNNDERLYLLKEETRHSIMIEGYFTNKRILKKVIESRDHTQEHSQEILGYFDAASLIYEYAYQKYQENQPYAIQTFDIKTIHSLMFKHTDHITTGTWRSGDIMIHQANIQPITGGLVDQAMRYAVEYTNTSTDELIERIAKFHVLFESTHPFEDGNGRVGRVLTNYLLISQGYPNIIIKGTEKNKQTYFDALESGETGLLDYYPSQITDNDWDHKGDFEPMKNILYKNLFESMDRMILSGVPKQELQPITNICVDQGYSTEYARKLAQRGLVIAKKIKNTRHSMPQYLYKR